MSEYEAEALQTQAQSAGVSFVEQVLLGKRMTAQQLAVFASRAFGTPLLDLASFDIDQIQKDHVDLKIAQGRRVLPLYKRSNKLFVRDFRSRQPPGAGGSALQDQPRARADRRRGRQALAAIARMVEQSGATLKDMANLEDMEIGLEDGNLPAPSAEDDSDVEDAPVVKYIQKLLTDAIAAGASDIHFEPYERYLPRPLPRRRHPVRDHAAAAGDQGQGGVAHQGHQPARHLGKARPAGRPHEARAVEDEGDRLPRFDAADALRREDRDAYPRLERRQARHRGARLRARPAGGADVRDRPSVRNDPGHRARRAAARRCRCTRASTS